MIKKLTKEEEYVCLQNSIDKIDAIASIEENMYIDFVKFAIKKSLTIKLPYKINMIHFSESDIYNYSTLNIKEKSLYLKKKELYFFNLYKKEQFECSFKNIIKLFH